jgi:hypothetical protein
MPVEITLDAVEDSLVRKNGWITEVIRTGWAKGVIGTTTEECLLSVLTAPGMPATNESLSGSYPNLKVRDIDVRPAGIPGKRKIRLRYDDAIGALLTTYSVERSWRDETTLSDFVPGTRQQVWCQYDLDGPVVDELRNVIPKRSIRMRVPASCDVLTITAVVAGDPPDFSGIKNRVNNASYLGYPIGYWKCAGVTTRQNKYDLSFSTWIASIATRCIEDWSDIHVLTDERTGQTVVMTEQEETLLAAQDYLYGVRGLYYAGGGGDSTIVNGSGGNCGACRVGLYDTADFASILGYSGS